nr:variable surface lipoprotein [Mycoplasmopsis bovis]
MNKRKLLLISSLMSVAPIMLAAKCNPDSDNIVEFRLGIKDLNLRFANYGAFSSKELDEMLKQKPLKDGEFTVVYPSSGRIGKRSKNHKRFFWKRRN